MTTTITPLPSEVDQLLQRLGVPRSVYTGGTLTVRSPISGDVIGQLPETTPEQAAAAIDRAQAASRSGVMCLRRVGVSWCVCWAKSCAPSRPIWACW